MVSISLAATIPVMAYGNITPTVTMEGDTVDEALERGLGHIQALWNRVGERPLQIRGQERPAGIEKRCWASGSIVYFDPIEHVYRDIEGNQYLGGSTFAHRFVPEFASEAISRKMADGKDVDPADILAMWELNSEASTSWGTALHAALELRQRYAELSLKLKGDYSACTTKNPTLRPIVEAFFDEERSAQNAVPECFVADPTRRHAGLIDRMVIHEDGSVDLEDYKTSRDLLKTESITAPFKGLVPNNQLGVFTLQLNFYRRILTAHGKTVRALRVWHWTGDEWQSHELEMLDLDKIMTEAQANG